jgi:hypothetical protein
MAINGVPKDLAVNLQEVLNAQVFIETGTYKGHTAFWASGHFDKVVTFEIDENRYNRLQPEHGSALNCAFILGDSGTLLADVLNAFQEPIIFWLDAHGLNNPLEITGVDTECPLMNELRIITEWQEQSKQPCAIFIDDARLFVKPPPQPWHAERWPNIVEIENYLKDWHIAIHNDIIVCVNKKYAYLVDEWVYSND